MLNTIANHSDFLLKLDLQQFSGDDVILPDDFVPEEPIEPAEPVEPVEPESTPEPTEPTELETPQQLLKVKYNKEEREIPIDEAIPLVQKGLNYDKVQERLQALESDPRLSFIEDLARQYDMTPQDYMEAVRQQQEQQRIQELVEQGISEELAQEMLENKKFREQYEAEKKAKAEEEQEKADYADFFNYFKQANGREFQPEQDALPESVWEAVNSGVPLKYAYMAHENNQLRTQLNTLKQNETNAKRAPVGSTTAHGGNEVTAEDDFLRGFNSI